MSNSDSTKNWEHAPVGHVFFSRNTRRVAHKKVKSRVDER